MIDKKTPQVLQNEVMVQDLFFERTTFNWFEKGFNQ